MRSAALTVLFLWACGPEYDDPEDALEAHLELDEDSPAEPDVGDPAELLALNLEGPELAAEVAVAPVRAAAQTFDRIGVLYSGMADTSIAIKTSADGETWSEWFIVEVEQDEEPNELGEVSFTGELPVVGGALFFRVIAVSESLPTSLSLELLDSSIPDDETSEDTYEEIAEGIGSTTSALRSFKRYRFGLGRVSKPWLWLLRTARREGWTGTLAGKRTGLRTYRQQAQLYQAYLNGTGAPAFPPWGPSRHLIRNVKKRGRWSQAVDTQDVARLIRIARSHGVRLHVPYSNEPWHVEARRKFRHPRGWTP